MTMVTAFVTRHCLSQGIRQMQGTVDEKTQTFRATIDGEVYEADASNWFLNWENAVKKAQKMQKQKVKDFLRYAAKVEKLTFNKPE